MRDHCAGWNDTIVLGQGVTMALTKPQETFKVKLNCYWRDPGGPPRTSHAIPVSGLHKSRRRIRWENVSRAGQNRNTTVRPPQSKLLLVGQIILFLKPSACVGIRKMVERPRRVAVIGAGVSGVTTAAHLKAEGLEVTVFERAPVAGGVWSV